MYTDHKNFTIHTLSIQRVLRWRICIDELDSSLQYIEGTKNILAVCFSQLPIMDQLVAVWDDNMNDKNKRTGPPFNFRTIKVSRDDILIDDERVFNMEAIYVKDKRINKNENNETMYLFLNLPPMNEIQNPKNM